MKILKKITLSLLLIFTLVSNFTLNVNATEVPQSIKLKSKSSMYYFSEGKGTDYINGYNFYRKELTNGSLAYCASDITEDVPAGKTLTLKGENTDLGLHYIIANGYPNATFTGNKYKDYYITQAAIWRYFDETRGSHNWRSSTFTSSSTGMKGYVYKLVQEAKLASNQSGKITLGLTLNIDDTKMNLSNDSMYFVSQTITATTKNIKDGYTVSLTKAPAGTFLKSTSGEVKTSFSNSEKFNVYVPLASLTDKKGEITLTAKATGVTGTTSYIYTTGNSKYQDIITVELYETTDEVVANLKLTYEKIDNTKIKISKQDITTKKELPGATLVVKDSKGNVVDTFVSTNEPHYIENLKVGTYTLTETIAPNGYVLSTETIEFTVKNDGKVETVVMYNEAKPETTKVKISKQDITTKEELPGATLVVKDSEGNVIDEWVSTSTPHYIEGLDEGVYTLTETIAPEGYGLSSETITFTVKADGEIQSVVMYNTRLVEVPITDLDFSKTTMIIASILILIGTGVVVYYVKYAK